VNSKTKTILTVLLGLTWAGVTLFGARALLRYENSPGKIGRVSSSWPADSTIKLADDRPTLLMLAHPQCPCTRASVAELAQVMARAQGKVSAYVLFYTPRESGADWQKTRLRRTAAQIPGVTVLSDVDGVEAQHFGAETSGHTFLFDPSGRLLFNGGITASRGHSGDNAGESSIVSLIEKHTGARNQTFVFGCALKNRDNQRKAAPCLR
jgi:hypothetical protein